jgi:hypothetical protein
VLARGPGQFVCIEIAMSATGRTDFSDGWQMRNLVAASLRKFRFARLVSFVLVGRRTPFLRSAL